MLCYNGRRITRYLIKGISKIDVSARNRKKARKIFRRLPKLHKQWMNIKHIWEIKSWPLRIHLSCVCFLLTDSHRVWDDSYDRTSVLKHCSLNATHLTQMGQIRESAYISLISTHTFIFGPKNHSNILACVCVLYTSTQRLFFGFQGLSNVFQLDVQRVDLIF